MKGAQLEGSKEFAKGFMERHNILRPVIKVLLQKRLKKDSSFGNIDCSLCTQSRRTLRRQGVLILPTLEEAKKVNYKTC